MAVLRIVANLAAADPQMARSFYERLLGLAIVMDHGWILTFASDGRLAWCGPQISVAAISTMTTPALRFTASGETKCGRLNSRDPSEQIR